MSRHKVGSKANSFLNGEWSKHVRRDLKKITSGIRRSVDKIIIKKSLTEINDEKNNPK